MPATSLQCTRARADCRVRLKASQCVPVHRFKSEPPVSMSCLHRHSAKECDVFGARGWFQPGSVCGSDRGRRRDYCTAVFVYARFTFRAASNVGRHCCGRRGRRNRRPAGLHRGSTQHWRRRPRQRPRRRAIHRSPVLDRPFRAASISDGSSLTKQGSGAPIALDLGRADLHVSRYRCPCLRDWKHAMNALFDICLLVISKEYRRQPVSDQTEFMAYTA